MKRIMLAFGAGVLSMGAQAVPVASDYYIQQFKTLPIFCTFGQASTPFNYRDVSPKSTFQINAPKYLALGEPARLKTDGVAVSGKNIRTYYYDSLVGYLGSEVTNVGAMTEFNYAPVESNSRLGGGMVWSMQKVELIGNVSSATEHTTCSKQQVYFQNKPRITLFGSSLPNAVTVNVQVDSTSKTMVENLPMTIVVRYENIINGAKTGGVVGTLTITENNKKNGAHSIRLGSTPNGNLTYYARVSDGTYTDEVLVGSRLAGCLTGSQYYWDARSSQPPPNMTPNFCGGNHCGYTLSLLGGSMQVYTCK